MKKLILTFLVFLAFTTICNAEVYRILNFDEESLPILNENFRRIQGKVLRVDHMERYTEFESIIDGQLKDNDEDTIVSVETITELADGSYAYSDDDTIRFDTGGTEQLNITDGYMKPTTNDDVDIGTTALRYSDIYLTDSVNIGDNGDDVVLDYDTTDNELDINQDVNVEKADPEVRITDTGTDEYSRLVRTDTSETMTLYNRTNSYGSGAMDFDGDDFCQIPYVNIGQNLTVAAWVKADTQTEDMAAVGIMGTAFGMYPVGSGSYLFFYMTSQNVVLATSLTINNATWYRIVVTYDDSGDYVFYLNGSNVASSNSAYRIATSDGLNAVGTGKDGASAFKGLVDEVIIFSEIKDQTWVTADYNSGDGLFYDSSAGAEYLYHLDKQTGSIIYDSSGNSRDSDVAFDGDPQWDANGKVGGVSGVTEIVVVQSLDAEEVGEAGINIYGDATARSTLEGVNIRFNVAGTEQFRVDDAVIYGTVDNDVDLGSSTKEFKDLYIDGLVYIDGFGEDTDLGDFDIHSIDGLYGVDDLVYIDMGTDGYVDIEADTQIRAYEDVNVIMDDPEIRMTDSGDSGYTRINRSDTSAVAARYNIIGEPGGSGYSLKFNGANHINLPYYNIGTTLTLSFWFNTSLNSGTNQHLFAYGKTYLFLDVTHGAANFAWKGDTDEAVYNIAQAISVDVWHHFVLSQSGTNLNVWFDGSPIAVDATVPAINMASGYQHIAAYANVDTFEGMLDEFGIFSSTKDQDWVNTYYNSGDGANLDSDDASCEMLYNMNTGTGTTCIDTSGNSRNSSSWTGTPTWETGKINVPGGDVEVQVWKSQDGASADEEGILTIGDIDGETNIQGSEIIFKVSDEQIQITNGTVEPLTDDDVDLGTATKQFKDAFIDGTLEADVITEGGVGVVNLEEIDTFSELDIIVADKTLVNEEDAVTWDATQIYSADTLHSIDIKSEYGDAAVHVSSQDDGYLDLEADIQIRLGGETAISATTDWLGLGRTPTAHLDVFDGTVNTTATYYGLVSYHTKTAGGTDENDTMGAGNFNFIINDTDSTVGNTYGFAGQAGLTDGTIGTGGANKSLVGSYNIATQAGGTINGSLYGSYNIADQAAGTITGNMYGMYSTIDNDGTLTGSAYGLYLNEENNVDYGIYQNGTAKNLFGGEVEVAGELDANGVVTLGDGGDNFSIASDGIDITTSGVITNATIEGEGGVISTGEGGGTKFLREDGDGTSSWQPPAGGGSANAIEATFTNECGATTVEGYVYRIDPDNDESFDYGDEDEDRQAAVATSDNIANSASGAMYVDGVVEVYLAAGETADIDLGLKWLYFHATDGQAKVSVNRNDGCFGMALEDGGNGALITCQIFPREVIRKWGWANEGGWAKHIRVPFARTGSWTKDAGNPIFEKAGSGTFDDEGISHPCVVRQGGYYYLFYSGMSTLGPTTFSGIGVARSTTPEGPFTRYGSNPIIAQGTNTNTRIPTVVYDIDDSDSGKRWKLWYQVKDAGADWRIVYAYASDPFDTWTVSGNVTDITTGTYAGNGPTCIKLGNMFYMIVPLETRASLQLWISSDGTSWGRVGTAMSVGGGGTWDDTQVAFAGVFWNLGTFYLFYFGLDQAGADASWSIGVARSVGFGKTYTKFYDTNPGLVLTGTESYETTAAGKSRIWSPSVMMVDDKFYMWYAAQNDGDTGEAAVCLATIP